MTRRRCKFHRKPAAELPWTEKIEKPGVMDLIEVEDVIDAARRTDGGRRAAHADEPAYDGSDATG